MSVLRCLSIKLENILTKFCYSKGNCDSTEKQILPQILPHLISVNVRLTEKLSNILAIAKKLLNTQVERVSF